MHQHSEDASAMVARLLTVSLLTFATSGLLGYLLPTIHRHLESKSDTPQVSHQMPPLVFEAPALEVQLEYVSLMHKRQKSALRKKIMELQRKPEECCLARRVLLQRQIQYQRATFLQHDAKTQVVNSLKGRELYGSGN
ncbi:hypothetical protein C8Q75DRAFT_810786 [Abortiporus biennis]|nr:hypothetical protein C8Q75DRAFT_810786 [Abortiporus biennis]